MMKKIANLWQCFADKNYRRGFAVSHAGGFLAAQIYSMRTAQGWSKRALALAIGSDQTHTTDFETSCEFASLPLLQSIADAFDVALVVKFVSFSELASEAATATPDSHVPSFDDEVELLAGMM